MVRQPLFFSDVNGARKLKKSPIPKAMASRHRGAMFDLHSFAVGVIAGLALGGPAFVALNLLLDWWEARQTVPTPGRRTGLRSAAGGGEPH